jgi:hypothetical protein
VKVDLGVPVLQVVRDPRICCSFEGNTVLIGPDLVSRKSSVEIQVVTEGRPSLVDVSYHLANTKVTWRPRKWRRSPKRGTTG